jgi:alpha-1,6-mannosyltransferase
VGYYHADLVRTYAEPLVKRMPAALGKVMGDGVRELARRFVPWVFSRFDVTAAASPSVLRELGELGVQRLAKVPLGVDLELFHPARRGPELRQEIGADPEKPIALFAGRLCPEKGLDVVVRAHADMDPGSRPHLLFVGEGPSEDTMRREAESRADFTVLPVVSDKERLARIYASADFYLAAGPGETFGLAVAEAMASGLPLVGVASGAVGDRLADSEAGEAYRTGDAASCRAAMERMTASLTPEAGEKARTYAEREFDWGRTFDDLCDLYAELAGLPTPSLSPAPKGAQELLELAS